jgi:hypothetical protein
MKRLIEIITGVLVACLAAASFALSYDALYQTARANGVTPNLVWLWPLTLDAVMIAASLSVLRNSMNGEQARYPWALVALFTVASVAFNVLHAGSAWLARSVFALPPIVVFLSVELLSAQVWSNHKRVSAIADLQAIDAQVQRAKTQLAQLQAAQADVPQQTGLEPVHVGRGASKYPLFVAAQRGRNGDGPMTGTEIVEKFGVDPSTAGRWLKRYTGEAVQRFAR